MKQIQFEQGDELRRETWQYWFNDREMNLRLDWYRLEERKTKRHGWREVKYWNWGSDNHYWNPEHIKRAEVPTPDEMRAEVLRRFVAQITIE